MLLIVVLTFTMLTGCFKSEPVTSDEPKVLRIFGDEYSVNENSSYFEIVHDNITIELIDRNAIYQEAYSSTADGGEPAFDPEVRIMEIINGPNPPDIIYLDQTQVSKYVDEGLLVALDSFIEKDKFDLEGIVPGVLEGIKDLGNGSIYALSPTFSAQALFYNKSLFDKMNVPYPEDRMSWEEIFNLAKQLAHEENDKQYYGFAFERYSDEYNQMNMYLEPLNLSIFNGDYTGLTIDSPVWEEIWELFAGLYKEGVLAPGYDFSKMMGSDGPVMAVSFFDRELFLGGRAAMSVGGFDRIRMLADIGRGNVYFGERSEQPEPFEWDIVTLPIHPDVGDVGGNLSIYGMMAINSKSDQQELAWKYISFMNGDKMAKVNAKKDWQLPTRFEYVSPPDGLDVNIDAFTLLKPSLNYTYIDFRKHYPNSSPYMITNLGGQLFKDVIEDKKTVKEALAEFQKTGQEELDRIIEQDKDDGN